MSAPSFPSGLVAYFQRSLMASSPRFPGRLFSDQHHFPTPWSKLRRSCLRHGAPPFRQLHTPEEPRLSAGPLSLPDRDRTARAAE